ncbi:hypothetical protein [Streptomyces lacrimifluminis]|nr:hypothetical protein [Streptomyces lacrimifluminis]
MSHTDANARRDGTTVGSALVAGAPWARAPTTERLTTDGLKA